MFHDRGDYLTPEQMRVCGPLELGRGAVLGGRAALLEFGWRADPGDWVDVVVPRGSRARGRKLPPWIRLHFSTVVPCLAGVPPRCTPARTAVDAAAWARTPREALFVLTSAVQQRVVSTASLQREVAGRTRLRHAQAIRDALIAMERGATTTTEADFLRECGRRGLPEPRMQVRRADGAGRIRRTDAEFDLLDGRLLIVEIDGVGHFDIGQWQADMVRGNGLAVTTGAMLMRVTGWEVRHDPDPFFTLLAGVVLGDAQSIPTV